MADCKVPFTYYLKKKSKWVAKKIFILITATQHTLAFPGRQKREGGSQNLINKASIRSEFKKKRSDTIKQSFRYSIIIKTNIAGVKVNLLNFSSVNGLL